MCVKVRGFCGGVRGVKVRGFGGALQLTILSIAWVSRSGVSVMSEVSNSGGQVGVKVRGIFPGVLLCSGCQSPLVFWWCYHRYRMCRSSGTGLPSSRRSRSRSSTCSSFRILCMWLGLLPRLVVGTRRRRPTLGLLRSPLRSGRCRWRALA